MLLIKCPYCEEERSELEFRAGIVSAIGDARPAVVAAGLWQVHLVAAARAVFGRKQHAVLGIDGQALRVAVTL